MDKAAMMQHGAFSWNELVTNNTTAAKAFYSELFGWTLHDEEFNGTTYTVINQGDQAVGGITSGPAEAGSLPTDWGCYITVDDVDKQLILVEKLGGKIVMPPRDIPNVGRSAVISDPQGAMLRLITYNA